MAILLAVVSGVAGAEVKFDEGDWRVQVGGLYNFKAGLHDPADYFVTGSVEYEFPAYSHGKLGLRMLPLFYYPSKEDAWGFGLSLATRIYQNQSYDGFFGELEGGGLWLTHAIEGNSTRGQFLFGAGLGYKFPETHWDVSVKYTHISNGGLGNRNAGSNGVGLAVGYSF